MLRNLSFKISTTAFLAFLISINLFCSRTQKPSNNNNSIKAEKIDSLINLYSNYGEFNGSILVVNKGEVIYKKGVGWANMEWNIPNDINTKFRIGSITKQFTAMLIMQLVAEKKIELNVPISRYLPNYPKPNADIITVHHLLTHSSGIPNYTSFSHFWDIQRENYKAEDFIKIFSDSTLQFTPGDKFNYSNSGYFLLGYIAEKVTGKSYEKLLEDKIFIPLNMKNTGYDHHYSLLDNRASGYQRDALTRMFKNANYISMSLPYAAGALYSTVEDMYLWDRALYTEELLPKGYLDLIFEEHIISDSGNYHYGYGWNIEEYPVGNSDKKEFSFNHDGGIDGFTSLITRFPKTQSLIVIFNNTGRSPNNRIARAINGILMNTSYDLPKKSVAHSLREMIPKEDLNKGIQYYHKIKDSSGFYLNEREINLLGYFFLEKGETQTAKSIFKLNIDAFPKAFNVYDSYAESLMKLGEKDASIKNYKKSLKLNPDNNNAREMLKKLENK